MAKRGLSLESSAHFKNDVFLMFSKIHAIRRLLRSPGGSWASPGTLWGGPGANNQTKVTATLRPAVPRVLRLRAGGQSSTRPRNTRDRRAESLRRDKRVFNKPRKIQGFLACWHPGGPKLQQDTCICVFFVPRRLQERPPEGHEHKTFVNRDRIWGFVLVSFSCPLRFLLRVSGFLFGAVLAAPSVPQGCLGDPFWVLLRAARGAQKGPPYLSDSLFLGSL